MWQERLSDVSIDTTRDELESITSMGAGTGGIAPSAASSSSVVVAAVMGMVHAEKKQHDGHHLSDTLVISSLIVVEQEGQEDKLSGFVKKVTHSALLALPSL
jgi:hypothetical protein